MRPPLHCHRHEGKRDSMRNAQEGYIQWLAEVSGSHLSEVAKIQPTRTLYVTFNVAAAL